MGIPLVAAIAAGLVTVLGSCGRPLSDLPPPPVPAQLDQLDPAIATLIRSTLAEVAANETNLRLRVKLGMIFAANELHESAQQCLQQAVDHGYDDPRTWYHLAHVRAGFGDVQGAVAALERVIALEPEYAPAHWQGGLWRLDRGEIDEAETAFKLALEVDPSVSAGWLGRARVHLRRGENQEAVDLLEAYLAGTDENRVYTNHLLGTAYRQLGRLDRAEAALRRGRGSNPEYVDPWREELEVYAQGYKAELKRAKIKAEAGDYNGALTILNRMRREHSVKVEVYNNIGLSYMAIGRTDLAIETLGQGLAVNPNSLEAHHLLAGTCWLSSSSRPPEERARLHERARAHVQRALDINPAYVPALVLYADIRAADGDLSGAIEAYREAARWDPENSDWLYKAAMLAGRLRRWDQVVEFLEAVTSLSPAFNDAASRLGLAYLAVGRLDEAETALHRARRLNPDLRQTIEVALLRVQELRRNAVGPAPR